MVVYHQSSQLKLRTPLQVIVEIQTSRQSPSVDSPPGYGDSPHSASFPSHSELDDYIIDEILSLEDDQLARKQQPPLPGTYSCTDNLATLSHHHAVSSAGRPIPVSSSSSTAAVVVVGSASPSGYNRQVSSSAPASSLDMDSLVRQEVVLSEQEFFRDRRKKDIHNMIERRRRYNINDRIKELGMMLPKHSSEDMKLNKGTILKASCDYIRHLQRDRDHMTRVSIQQSRLETTARLYADRIKELEAQLQKNGITIPPATLPAMPTTIMTRSIKQEPIDDSNSPINTPSGSMSSSVFMSQLSDTTAAMAITSPTAGHHHHQHTAPSSFFSVASSRSPDSPSFSTPQQQLSSNNWQQQQQQHFPDLIMEDLATIGGTGQLLQGDPMISAAGGGPSPQTAHSQMSPDVQWDQAGFSPDSDSRNSSHHHHQHHQMDFS
jgi:hypothetical protein